MADKFNPYESEHGPGYKDEFGILIPVSTLLERLAEAKSNHSDQYLKRCPHCDEPVIFYRNEWYFCQQHNFVKLGEKYGWAI